MIWAMPERKRFFPVDVFPKHDDAAVAMIIRYCANIQILCHHSEHNHQNGAAGSLASLLSDIVLCPTELVKCKLQVNLMILFLSDYLWLSDD